MTTKENLAETIKKSRPKAKDSTIKMYVSNLMKLMKMFEKDDLKFLNKPKNIADKLSELHYTTQRNYYNAIIVYLMALKEDEETLKEYNDLRDDLNKKYEDEQATGTISDKQDVSKEIYKLPTSTTPYNAMFDLKRKFALFTKSKKSKSLYCAGYFCISFEKGWVKSFCPKLVTLEKYQHKGPFKTELEMRQELSNVNRG